MDTVDLHELHYGSEIGIDSRRSGRDDGIEELARSIVENTPAGEPTRPLQPLGVWRDESGTPFVAFGNRRLRALHWLVETAGIGSDHPVPVTYLTGSLADVLAMSIAENNDRLDLHPVDQYEDFAGLVRQGMSEAQVAQRYGMEPKAVKQALALGRLAPEVLAAWRDGKITEACAQAFTLEADHGQQASVLAALQASHQLHLHDIKRAIVGNQQQVGRYLAFVTAEAYQAAGGVLATDLFGEAPVVLSHGVLQQLVVAKLAVRQAELLADGWGAVLTEFERPDDWYSWAKAGAAPAYTEAEAARLVAMESEPYSNAQWNEQQAIKEAGRLRGLTVDEKAAATCLVSVSWDGDINETLGQVPAAAKPPKADAAAEPGAPPPEPAKVVDQLRKDLTNALAATVAADPPMALAVLLARMCSTAGPPVHVRLNGASGLQQLLQEGFASDLPFDQVLAKIVAATPSEAQGLLATLVASAVDATTPAWGNLTHSAKGVTQAGIEALADVLDPESLLANLREHFDAAAYFTGATAASCVAALEEAVGPAEAKAYAKKRKGDLAKRCVFVVPGTGWLPPALRFAGYVHHAAAEPVVEAPAKPARRKRTKAAPA